MNSLFDACVAVVLKSISLLRRAAVVLPKNVAQLILFEACSSNNHLAVEAVVETWPHSKLSFDFMSNTFCRKRKEQGQCCIEPHEFYNVHSTDNYSSCVHAIALGLFHSLQMNLQSSNVSVIEEVDLSKIRLIEQQQVIVLCKLIGGEFPVTHASDYVNPSDTKAFSISKPKLSGNISRRIILRVTIRIDSHATFVALKRIFHSSNHFEVILSGLEFPSHLQKKYLKYFNDLYLNEIFIDLHRDLFKSDFSSPRLTECGTLWLNTDSPLSEKLYRDFTSRLNIAAVSLVITRLCSSILVAIMNENILVHSFCVLPPNQPSLKSIIDLTDLFGEFLQFNSNVLEYLHLNSYFFSMLPLQSLQMCRNLRTISITMNLTTTDYFKRTATPVQIFKSLQNLNCLEYLEWSEPLNIVTRDVLALFELLSNHLPRLGHWHWKLNSLLLFTTDLDDADFEPLQGFLNILLEGKVASPWCSTFKFDMNNVHFKRWLESIRPQTCFCCVSFPRDSQLRFSML